MNVDNVASYIIFKHYVHKSMKFYTKNRISQVCTFSQREVAQSTLMKAAMRRIGYKKITTCRHLPKDC